MSSPITNSENPLKGSVLILSSLICFSCSDAASKAMTETIPSLQVAWMRFLIFTILMLSVVFLGKGRHTLRSRRPVLQIIRGLGVLGSAAFFIMGLRYLPMAEATAISFVSPVFVTALSIFVLGESVGIRRWLAVFVGLIGVLIVVRPGTGAFDAYAIFSIASAVSWATALVVTRKMSSADGPVVALTYAAIIGLVVTSAFMPFEWVTPGWREIGLGLITGISSTVAQFLVVLAFQNARASVLAPFSYTQLIWSSLLGFIVFHNIPDFWTIVGACVIVSSGLYTAHRERVRKVPIVGQPVKAPA